MIFSNKYLRNFILSGSKSCQDLKLLKNSNSYECLVFEKAFARMTDAFVARAFELYGENGSAGEIGEQ